jgi:hypothetical protein
MSAGTQRLLVAMDAHEANKAACQAANSQKAVCDVNFSVSAQQVAEAQKLVESEVEALAVASTQPLPNDKQVVVDPAPSA